MPTKSDWRPRLQFQCDEKEFVTPSLARGFILSSLVPRPSTAAGTYCDRVDSRLRSYAVSHHRLRRHTRREIVNRAGPNPFAALPSEPRFMTQDFAGARLRSRRLSLGSLKLRASIRLRAVAGRRDVFPSSRACFAHHAWSQSFWRMTSTAAGSRLAT